MTCFEVTPSARDVILGSALVVKEGVEAAELATVGTGVLFCSAVSGRTVFSLAGDETGHGHQGEQAEKELHSGKKGSDSLFFLSLLFYIT
jgi:hypothetical protein